MTGTAEFIQALVAAVAAAVWDKPRSVYAVRNSTTHQLAGANSANESSGVTESGQSVSLTERGCLTRSGWRKKSKRR